VNKSVALLMMTFSFLFGDDNVQVRHGNQQVAQGEFIGTYMNHVHILVGENIYYYACDDIISITYASAGFSYGKGYDYDCSINTVTADILFPPELDPMTGEMAQMLPDVFNPDIPKLAVEKATPVVQNPAAKIEAGGVSATEDFVVIDGVKYARVAPEKETAKGERQITADAKSWLHEKFDEGAINEEQKSRLEKVINVINKFQAGSVSKPAQTRNNQTTYNNAGSATKFNACQQAGLDAVASTSPLWYGGGLMYPIGVPAYFLSKPQPDVLEFSKIPNEEQMLYMECYKTAAQNERGKRMALGCGGYIFAAFVAMSTM
jgi:hypothetical protein